MSYEELEARLAAWAQTQPAVRAVIVCGSRARGDADQWSDLDAILFTTDRQRYAADSSWLKSFGDLVLAYLEPTDPGDAEWYALYDGGLKLDAVLLQVEDASLDLEALLTLYPYQGVFARGIHVLFDRRGAPRRIPPKPIPLPAPPTAAEFESVVHGFLLAAATTAKFVARGDYWRAQHWFAADLRPHLLKLIQWHAHGRDTWYSGRFIDQWADERIVAALPQAFALYERESLSQALRSLLDLFRTRGDETAARFGFTYPAATHAKVAALVEAILAEPAKGQR